MNRSNENVEGNQFVRERKRKTEKGENSGMLFEGSASNCKKDIAGEKRWKRGEEKNGNESGSCTDIHCLERRNGEMREMKGGNKRKCSSSNLSSSSFL